MAEAQRQKQPRYEDNNKNNNNSSGNDDDDDDKCEMQTARRKGMAWGMLSSGQRSRGSRTGGQWLLVGDKNRIGRQWAEDRGGRGQGGGRASQTFAAEYVKCFGKCVPNVVDERASGKWREGEVEKGHRKRFARSRRGRGEGRAGGEGHPARWYNDSRDISFDSWLNNLVFQNPNGQEGRGGGQGRRRQR